MEPKDSGRGNLIIINVFLFEKHKRKVIEKMSFSSRKTDYTILFQLIIYKHLALLVQILFWK